MKRLIALVLTLATFVSADVAAQADAPLFDYQITSKAQTDQGAPVLTLRAREFIKSGTVTFERGDGKKNVVRLGKMKPAQEKRIPFAPHTKGTFKWKVTVEGASQFDQTMNQQFETETAWVDPIQLQVDPEKVDVGTGSLVLNTNVPLDKVDIEVFDNNGKKIVETTQTIGGKSGDVDINWAGSGEVGAIRLRATDVAGFWSAVLLEPFWVDIPHREVEFHFGKATWEEAETPKLEETLKAVKQAMERHKSKGLKMQLYIAGYTDTVGGHGDNMALSKSRARAIAQWFRKSGVNIPILYQGFGESVLAVKTPDNTPEARNRRAVYILGNSPPPTSAQIPRRSWHRL